MQGEHWVAAGDHYVNLRHVAAVRRGSADALGRQGQTVPLAQVTLYTDVPTGEGDGRLVIQAYGPQAELILDLMKEAAIPIRPFVRRDVRPA